MRAAFLSAVLITLLSAGSADAARPACASAGKTVIRNSLVRVYEQHEFHTGEDRGEETVTVDEDKLYGCWLATGQRQRIDSRCSRHDLDFGNIGRCDETWRVANVKGPYVAVAVDREGTGIYTRDVIFTARIGPGSFHRLAYKLPRPTDRFGEPEARHLYVSRSGNIAFSLIHVASHALIGYLSPKYRELDSGPEVVAKSLHPSGHRLSWKHGARTRHARFP